MAIVHFDSSISDDERRERIFRGEIFVYGPTKHGRALVEHARSMIEAAFAPRSPEHAQYDMQVEDFAALLGKLKPSFIHHPTSKALVRGIMDDVGADPELTYFDVPKLRTSTSDEYLTTGISLAFPPHRDTWYAAPFCQINWWTPIYDITSDNGMSFHPYYWNRPIKNSAVTIIIGQARRPIAPVERASASISGRLFDDVTARKGAPNIDSACRRLRDFIRGTDHARLRGRDPTFRYRKHRRRNPRSTRPESS